MEDDDYQVISLKISWASLSIFLFLFALSANYLLQFLPWRPRRLWLWPLVQPVVSFGLSLLGFLSGLIGLRFSVRRGVARAGILLNGVVLAIVLSIAAVWFYIVAGR